MKYALMTLSILSFSNYLCAFEVPMAYDESKNIEKVEFPIDSQSHNEKVVYLTKLIEIQQKSYDNKIAYLENELKKTNDRLIEKSLNQDKIQENVKEKYEYEMNILKKELAYKTRSVLETQRMLEKMKPSEDMKNLIKLNTELASELRRNEDQVAVYQLKQIESNKDISNSRRMPASVEQK